MGVDETLRRAFEDAWFSGDPPAIDDFLPAANSRDFGETLVELVHADLEFRWKRSKQIRPDGQPSLIPEYLERFDFLREPKCLEGLIQNEWDIRCHCGDVPSPGDYSTIVSAMGMNGTFLESYIGLSKPARNEITSGQQLGKYRLLELCGQGAFGEVWRVYDPVLDRDVALKTLSRHSERHAEFRSRFNNEARITGRLEHPGIVSVHEFGESNGVSYYTMRLLEGETLTEYIANYHAMATTASEKPVAKLRLLNAFLSVVRTMEFAHNRGVIHRDLKPDNIIIGPHGETSILDWGLAKADEAEVQRHPNNHPTGIVRSKYDVKPALHPTAEGPESNSSEPLVTADGTQMGTPAYMSPEQFRGNPSEIGFASDQYVLGGILYQIMTGLPPFPAGRQSHTEYPKAVEQVRADVHPALKAVCRRTMSNEVADRYPSLSGLAEDLERYLADEPLKAFAEPWTMRAARWMRKNRTLVVSTLAAAMMALLSLIVGVVLLVGANTRTREALNAANENLYSQRVGMAHVEYSKGNAVRAEKLLAACPESLRNWEWHHLDWLIHKDKPLLELRGHNLLVRSVTFSDDGRLVATGDDSGLILVHDVNSGETLHEFRHTLAVRDAAFVDSGRILITAGADRSEPGSKPKGSLCWWSIETGELLYRRECHGKVARAISRLDDSKIATVGGSDELLIHDLQGMLIRSLPLRKSGTRVVATKPGDEHTLVYGDGGSELVIFNLDAGQEIGRFRGHPKQIYGVAWISDDKLATVGSDEVVRVWRLVKDKDKPKFLVEADQTLVGHSGELRSISFDSNSGTLATAGFDHKIRFWSVKRGDIVATNRNHSSHVRNVSFSRDGQWFSSVDDSGSAKIWRVADLGVAPVLVGTAEFSQAERNVIVHRDRTLEVWSYPDRKKNLRISKPDETPAAFCTSDNGALAIETAKRGKVTVFNLQSGNITRSFEPESRCYAVSFLDGPHAVLLLQNGDLQIYDCSSGTVVRQVKTRACSTFALAVSHQANRIIAGADDGTISIFAADTLEKLGSTDAHERYILSVAFDPDNDLIATAGMDGRIHVWDAKSLQNKWTGIVGASWVNTIKFTPDGSRLITGDEQTITYWDTETGQEIVSLSLENCVHHISFSADGKYLSLSGEDPVIRFWQRGR